MPPLFRLLAIYSLIIVATFIGLVLGGLIFGVIVFMLPDSNWLRGGLYLVLAIAGAVAAIRLYLITSPSLREQLLSPGPIITRQRLILCAQFALMAFAFCWTIGAVMALTSLNG